MAKCAYCGTTILFGGRKAEDLRFCNDKCLASGQVLLVAGQVPETLVGSQAREIFSGPCPVCNQKQGPVDVHASHKIMSFLIMTSWSSNPRVSCNRCGTKAQLGALVYSILLGWWGIPWGILMTPVQIGKNIIALLKTDTSTEPSDQLRQIVRMSIASQALESNEGVTG